jgi:hypothetical protein
LKQENSSGLLRGTASPLYGTLKSLVDLAKFPGSSL